MSRVRDVVVVLVCGIVLSVAGAGAASATGPDCASPTDCATACGSGLDLSGLLDGLLGGLFGGGCC